MRKFLWMVPAALLVIAACGTSVSPVAPETSGLQPADGQCSDDFRPC